MVSHDTFSPLPLQGRYGQIPTLFEIACGRDRQVPDHAMSPTSSTLKSWSIFNSFTNFSIISCDIFLIPSRTGDKGVVFVVVLSCNCGFDDMVCCWGISGTRQQMWEARCVLLCFALQHYSLAACLKATKKGAKPRPPRSSFHEPHVHHVFQLRGVLTKSFLPNFRIISGFIAVGITCRLRISGLGPVSYWYHDTNLWYLFWPPPKKRYHVIPANLFAYHMTYFYKYKTWWSWRATRIPVWRQKFKQKNNRENSTWVVWSTKALLFLILQMSCNPACRQICNYKRPELLLLFQIKAKRCRPRWLRCLWRSCL